MSSVRMAFGFLSSWKKVLSGEDRIIEEEFDWERFLNDIVRQYTTNV